MHVCVCMRVCTHVYMRATIVGAFCILYAVLDLVTALLEYLNLITAKCKMISQVTKNTLKAFM